MQPTLRQFLAERPGEVALVVRHLPLSRVGVALPFAIGAECAAAQGRFAAFADLAFVAQDTLPLVDLAALAKAAGVRDLPTFQRCRLANGTRERIFRDARAAHSAGIFATPTLVVGNRALSGAATLEELRRWVDSDAAANAKP